MVLTQIIFSCPKLQMMFYDPLSSPGYLKGELDSNMDLCVIMWDVKFGSVMLNWQILTICIDGKVKG